MLPGPAKIGPEINANDVDVTRAKARIQLAMECVCLCSSNFILDRDVRLPRLSILRAEPGYEVAFQRGTKTIEFRAGDHEGDTSTEMPDATDLGYERIHFFDRSVEAVDNPRLIFARKPMKHRQVGTEEASVWREMRLS